MNAFRAAAIVLLCGSVVVLAHVLLVVQPASLKPKVSNAEHTYAVEKRTAWTSSRVIGSPEPPSPYRTERIFSKLKFVEPLEMVVLPGSDRFVLAEHAGKIYSFPNDPDCESADV